MKFSNLFLTLVVIGLCGIAKAAFEDSDGSHIKIYNLKGQTIVEKNLTNYEVVMSEEEWAPSYILKSKTSEKQNYAVDGVDVSSTISLFKLGKEGSKISGSPLWTKSIKGGEVKSKWQFVSSTTWGCCAAPNLTTLYRLNDGKPLLTFLNDQIFRLSIPNQTSQKPRFVSVIDQTKPSISNKNLTNVATISYMNSEGVILDRIFLYVNLPQGWGTDLTDFKAVATDTEKKNEIRDQEIQLWSSDGKTDTQAFSGIALEGSFYYEDKEVKFSIPIHGDSFDLEKTKNSSLLSIER